MSPYLFSIVSVIIFALDRITKTLVLHNVSPGSTIPIIPPMLNLTFVTNSGAAFGILQDKKLFFIIVTIIAMVAILYYFYTVYKVDKWSSWALSFVFGGAISNFYDRLTMGEVIDFIDVGTMRWRWPAFNIADTSICIGVMILIIVILFEKKTEGLNRHTASIETPEEPSNKKEQ